MTTITIEVRGGLVQEVTCDGSAHVCVIVKDYDNLDDDGEYEVESHEFNGGKAK